LAQQGADGVKIPQSELRMAIPE